MVTRIGRVTTDEYLQLIEAGAFEEDERVELIRGEIKPMSPAGPYHGDIVFYLNAWTAREGLRYGYGSWPQQGVRLDQVISVPEPDIVWVKRRRYKRALPTLADIGLVIEVAHWSLRGDRKDKLPLYAEAGINEYWIANCDDSCIEVYRKPFGNDYSERLVVAQGEKIAPIVAPEAWLDVRELFAEEDT